MYNLFGIKLYQNVKEVSSHSHVEVKQVSCIINQNVSTHMVVEGASFLECYNIAVMCDLMHCMEEGNYNCLINLVSISSIITVVVVVVVVVVVMVVVSSTLLLKTQFLFHHVYFLNSCLICWSSRHANPKGTRKWRTTRSRLLLLAKKLPPSHIPPSFNCLSLCLHQWS